MNSFHGPVQQMVEDRLSKAFEPLHLEVINESHGRIEDESHFKVIVVSEAFDGLSLIKRHRAVRSPPMLSPSPAAVRADRLTRTVHTTVNR